MNRPRVAVSSPSFSASAPLIDELKSLAVNVVATNKMGVRMNEADLSRFLEKNRPDILIVGLEPVTPAVIASCPGLKLVCKYGVGLDNIDMEALGEAGIKLGWTGGVNRRSVSELVLAFALGHARNVFNSVVKMRAGIWAKDGGRQLSDMTFGIVGLGHIGADLARLLRSFGCEVLFNDIEDKSVEAAELGIRSVNYKDLLSTSDVVSFHVPSSVATRGMFGEREICQTRPHTLIINTARGDIVDFIATCAAVREGRLGGYASDVFPHEPLESRDHEDIQNLYFTPHIGGNAREAVSAMGKSAIAHVRTYLSN